MSELTVWTATV